MNNGPKFLKFWMYRLKVGTNHKTYEYAIGVTIYVSVLEQSNILKI